MAIEKCLLRVAKKKCFHLASFLLREAFVLRGITVYKSYCNNGTAKNVLIFKVPQYLSVIYRLQQVCHCVVYEMGPIYYCLSLAVSVAAISFATGVAQVWSNKHQEPLNLLNVIKNVFGPLGGMF